MLFICVELHNHHHLIYFYLLLLYNVFMNKTFKLASIAMLTALGIVTNLFTIPLSGSNSMSFTIAIGFFSGIYLGALPAAVVGFLGDLIAHLILPHGAYNLYLALSTTLFGVICVLIYKIKMPKLVKLIVAAVICYIVCLCGLNTLGLWMVYKAKVPPTISGLIALLSMDRSQIDTSFWLYLAGRAPWSAINMVINIVIVAVLQQSGVVEKLMTKVRDKYTSPPTQQEQQNDPESDNTPK